MVSKINKYILDDVNKALKYYPLLRMVNNNGHIIVEGEIHLVQHPYGEVDRYNVQISFPKNYPKRFPLVIETDNKIPRIPDRHVNSDDTLCLAVLPEELKIARNGITFKYFLDKVLVPHLGRETYYNIEKIYPDGEYEHGKIGIWKYFEEIFNVTDKQFIINELKVIVNHNKMLERNVECICGSGLKFKKCHLVIWNKVLEVGRENIKLIMTYLEEAYE
jgi:hypothetical protein